MEDTIIPMTDAQVASRDRADAELRRDYPGQYVAYLDVWNGNDLTRTVVAASPDLGTFHRLQEALPDAVYHLLGVQRVSAPDEPLFASLLLFTN
jgi:hypothetical protein